MAFLGLGIDAMAQVPTISPTVEFTDATGQESTETSFSGSAPIHAVFKANPSDDEGWTATYRWVVTWGKMTLVERYTEDMEMDFINFGPHKIVCYATFVKDDQKIECSSAENAFGCSPTMSKLEMPNAFSPNGDGINDIYKPREGYTSIIEFHATIYNRYGQRLYEWTDPEDGWDGTFNGRPVKDGVYFCQVKAKGADGREIIIKRDVTLLRKYYDEENVTY